MSWITFYIFYFTTYVFTMVLFKNVLCSLTKEPQRLGELLELQHADLWPRTGLRFSYLIILLYYLFIYSFGKYFKIYFAFTAMPMKRNQHWWNIISSRYFRANMGCRILDQLETSPDSRESQLLNLTAANTWTHSWTRCSVSFWKTVSSIDCDSPFAVSQISYITSLHHSSASCLLLTLFSFLYRMQKGKVRLKKLFLLFFSF